MVSHVFRNTLFWMGLVFALFATGVAVGISFLAANDARYRNEAIVVMGTVVNKYATVSTDSDGDQSTTHYVEYSFEPMTGPSRRAEDTVSRSLFNNLSEGDRIEVSYLPDETDRSRITANATQWFIYPLLGLFVVVFGGVGFGLLFGVFRHASRVSGLAKTGAHHVARVIEISGTNTTINGERQYQIVYEYEGPKGEPIRGKSTMRRFTWFEGIMAGDEINIRVDLKRPKVSAWEDDLRA